PSSNYPLLSQELSKGNPEVPSWPFESNPPSKVRVFGTLVTTGKCGINCFTVRERERTRKTGRGGTRIELSRNN
ncbi:unnamed protein product, partial [Prunus brigantina]